MEIDPNRMLRDRVVSPVVIEGIISDGNMLVPRDGGELTFEAARRNLSFRFTALSFAVPLRVRFKYKLEGFDARWIEAGTRREAFYTDIPGGEYTFRVIACNNDGVWNEAGAAKIQASTDTKQIPFRVIIRSILCSGRRRVNPHSLLAAGTRYRRHTR